MTSREQRIGRTHRRLLRTLLVGVAAMVATVMGVTSAQAAPGSYGGYGGLAHEGVYPTGNHACGGTGWSQPVASKKYVYEGRTLTIRLCYNPSYGAYARLDGAKVNDGRCAAFTDRTFYANDKSSFATVYETVDGGVGFAYTMVANNLNGRLARAAVHCNGGPAVAQTAWY